MRCIAPLGFILSLLAPAFPALEITGPPGTGGEIVFDNGLPARRYEFQLVNTGAGPVTIRKVDLGCGCLIARSSSDTLQPGESSSLEVALGVMPRSEGRLHQSVAVESLDGSIFRFPLAVRICSLIDITESALIWGKEDNRPRTVYVRSSSGFSCISLEVFSSPFDVRVTLEPAGINGFYALRITPLGFSTGPKRNIIVRARFINGRTAYVSVKLLRLPR